MFYLFYGDNELIETLFQFLIANALKPQGSGRPVVVYMLCGNYRRERTEIGTEALMELIENSGYGMEEALRGSISSPRLRPISRPSLSMSSSVCWRRSPRWASSSSRGYSSSTSTTLE